MTEIRRRIEDWFEGLARLIFRRRWLTLVLMLALAAALAWPLPRLTMDTSNEGFLRTDDPIQLTYNWFREQFGQDEMIIIALKPPRVFDLEFLKWLKALHDDLAENVPHLDDIFSLINARDTRGQGDSLIVGDLLEKMPRNEADLAALKERTLSNPLYVNRLISADGAWTALALKTDAYSSLGLKGDALSGFDEAGKSDAEALSGFDQAGDRPAPSEARPFLSDQENTAVILAVQEVLARHRAADIEVHVAGSPVVTHWVKRSMIRDMSLFMRLVILVIGLCLFIMFRRLSGVLLPLLIVALALVSTLGLMAWFRVPIKTPTMILPSFLLAVGVGAAVHILSLFYQELQKNSPPEEAIASTLGHSGLAVVMTALTTAAGLGSFATAEVAPIADLGVFASLGVLLSLVYTIILLPALLAIFPIKTKRPRQNSTGPFFDRVLDWVTDFTTGRPKTVTAVSLILAGLAVTGAARLSFTHDVLTWLPEDLPVRRATLKIDQALKGTLMAEFILDTGRENGLYDPETLKKLDRLAREFEAFRDEDLFVGKATSVADIIKEIHQALHEDKPQFYAVPDNPALIPQEFLLFENSGSDDLEDVVDSRFRLARFTLRLPWRDSIRYVPFIAGLADRFQAAFGPEAKVTITGLSSIFSRTVYVAVRSAARSYIVAFVVISLLMILLIGSLKIGLLAMLPNLAPIFVTLGLMGWLGFPFDMFTMLIGSIAIGLAVDDTIHFMHHFRRYYALTGDPVESVRQTLHTAGRAMLVASVVLSLGFFILMLASMNNIYYFGLLTGLAIILALLADFFMSPALMVLIHRPARDETKEV